MKPIGTVGELRALLAQYYDGQPIAVIDNDTSEEYTILFTETNSESEVEIYVRGADLSEGR